MQAQQQLRDGVLSLTVDGFLIFLPVLFTCMGHPASATVAWQPHQSLQGACSSHQELTRMFSFPANNDDACKRGNSVVRCMLALKAAWRAFLTT